MLILLLALSCDDEQSVDRRGELIEASDTPLSLPLSLTASWFNDLGLSDATLPQYDIQVYSITYYTVNADGKSVPASGAVYVPVNTSGRSLPLLSIHHGTTFERDQVASVNAYYNSESIWAATNGFLVSCPDGLGLGVSEEVHPYILAEGSATATIDMLRAVKTFAGENNIPLNNQLFLAGYSEGGYVTMATHKFIEEYYSDEFTVTASAPMAGPYDVRLMADLVLDGPTYDNPGYFGYIFVAYRTVYNLPPISDIFQSPYAGYIDFLYDGSHSGGEINDSLTVVLSDLFTPDFLSDFHGNGVSDLKAALDENDVSHWTATAPVHLFHGLDDMTVPYAISVATAEVMSLPLASFPGDHGGAAVACLDSAFAWLESYVTP